MEMVISWSVFLVVLAGLLCVILRQRDRHIAINAAADARVKAAQEAAEAKVKSATATADGLRSELSALDAENERLDRENFRLDLERKLREQYGVCEACGSKETHKTLRDDRAPAPRNRIQRVVMNE